MLKIQSLASGSKGNCTFVSNGSVRLLVDVGLRLPQLLARLESANIKPESISGILITHEHSDHIVGVWGFIKRFGCKLYVHESAKTCFLEKIGGLDEDLIVTFRNEFVINGRCECVVVCECNLPKGKCRCVTFCDCEVLGLVVDSFPVPHDSNFCFGYTFKCGESKFSLATDLGTCSDATLQKMAGSQVVLLESNHCPVKLRANVKYPSWLKSRVAGSHGHLSNADCGRAIYKLASMGVEQVILAHLSEENNSPSLAYRVVKDFLEEKGLIEGEDIFIDVAEQNKVGKLIEM